MEKRKFRAITVLADIIILAISFLAMAATKPAGLKILCSIPFTIFCRSRSDVDFSVPGQWQDAQGQDHKFYYALYKGADKQFHCNFNDRPYNVPVKGLLLLQDSCIRDCTCLATILELLFGSVYIAYKKALVQDYEDYEKYKTYKKPSEYDLVMGTNGNGNHHDEPAEVHPWIINAIEAECGPEMARAVLECYRSETDRAHSSIVNYHDF